MQKIISNYLILLDKPEIIFLLFGVVFGTAIVFITPIFNVPDEGLHLLRACEVSNLVIHNDKNIDISKDLLPNRKALVKKNCSKFSAFKDQKHYTNLFEFKDLSYKHNNTGYSAVLYLSSGISIKLTSLFTNNPFIIFYLARLVNLAIWLVLIYFAIKITPILKYQFLFCALFPMSIFEGMSLSADSFNIAFGFLFVAFLFKLIYDKSYSIKARDIFLYVIFAIVSIFLKGVLLFGLLFFLISKEKLKYKNIIFFTIMLLCLILQYLYSLNTFIFIKDGVDFIHQKYLLTHNLLYMTKMLIITILHQGDYYLRSSICQLGWLDIKPFRLFNYLIFFIFLSISVFDNTIMKIKKFDKYYALFIIILFVLLTHILYFLTFTNQYDSRIQGVQGRYFILLYPLLALLTANVFKLKLSEKQSRLFKTTILLIIFLSLSYTLFLLST